MDIFQRIGEIVVGQVLEDWREINVEAELDDDLADLCVWYFDRSGSEKYFNISRELTDCFIALRKVSGDPEKGLWSKCLFKLSEDGKFGVEFYYDPPRWK